MPNALFSGTGKVLDEDGGVKMGRIGGLLGKR